MTLATGNAPIVPARPRYLVALFQTRIPSGIFPGLSCKAIAACLSSYCPPAQQEFYYAEAKND